MFKIKTLATSVGISVHAAAAWALTVAIIGAPSPASAASLTNQPAPEWTLPWLSSGQARLADYRGKPVLIDFWASWCVPCRLSMPALESIQADYGDRITVLAISVDTDVAAAREFIERVAPGFPSLIDTEGAAAEQYDLIGMPSSFIVDGQGIVTYTHEGFRKGDDDVWRETIDALLAGDSD